MIKLVFYKLTAMSGRSMAKMRKIAPRMKALQERYKDDRQGLSQAMMELYKKREGESRGRLLADPDSDAVLLRVLLDARRERRDAPSAVRAVDRRSLGARPVLRAAGA